MLPSPVGGRLGPNPPLGRDSSRQFALPPGRLKPALRHFPRSAPLGRDSSRQFAPPLGRLKPALRHSPRSAPVGRDSSRQFVPPLGRLKPALRHFSRSAPVGRDSSRLGGLKLHKPTHRAVPIDPQGSPRCGLSLWTHPKSPAAPCPGRPGKSAQPLGCMGTRPDVA
jgi:hypothetical protein